MDRFVQQIFKKQAAKPRLVGLCGLFLMVAMVVVGGIGTSPAAPLPQVHPLPPTLAQWQPTRPGATDYFDQIPKLSLGYLVWSKFPVTVDLELADADRTREAAWIKAVEQAITDWQRYLPLQKVNSPEGADILIRRARMPLRLGPKGQILPMRMAETTYQIKQTAPSGGLTHQVTITLSPNQADLTLLAAARHELGHGLGIWGHSPDPTDVMYFSQVRQPPAISDRDISTLKRIYGQPTQLGW
jgi:predicted Zn-dependent protease